jgi:hypothetical protein
MSATPHLPLPVSLLGTRQQAGWFLRRGKLMRVAVNGGPAMTLADAPAGRGGAWSIDGTIIFEPDTQLPLMRIPANGGTPREVTKIDESVHTTDAMANTSCTWRPITPRRTASATAFSSAALLLYERGGTQGNSQLLWYSPDGSGWQSGRGALPVFAVVTRPAAACDHDW